MLVVAGSNFGTDNANSAGMAYDINLGGDWLLRQIVTELNITLWFSYMYQ